MSIAPKEMVDAAQKAASWMAGRLTPRGSYIGLVEPDANGVYADTEDISCYYKSTFFLNRAGRTDAAARLMRYFVDRFMTPDGDFRNSDTVRSSGNFVSGFSHLYSNSWAMRSMEGMGRHDLARRALEFMLKHREPNGGFHGGVYPPNTVIESNSTGVGCVCALEGHRPEVAIQTGEFLLKMFDAQPEPDKRLYNRMLDGKFLKPQPGEKYPQYFYIERNAPAQPYWPWSWPMIACIKLHRYTGERRYLDGAIRIYGFFAGGHSDAFRHQGAGKNSWASSMLYAITGEKRYRENALSQIDFILKSQHRDGFMMQPGVTELAGQPIRISYDFTPDYCTWLIENAQELASRP